MSHFSPTFAALLKEAQFTKELLGAGATDIRRANYAAKGVYFQSFVNLSTGLERIGKLCLMLDHYIENDGTFPTPKFLKDDIGHNLELLQQKALQVVVRRQLGMSAPSEPIHESIVRLLSEFAEGDRYSNINFLVGAQRQSDPIADWFEQVDLRLFESRVSAKKKAQIAENAHIIAGLTGHFTQVLHSSETGSEITDVEEASFRTGIFQAVGPYRQLYMLQIIRFWSELLIELGHEAQRMGKGDIPYFSELFGVFRNDDAYMKTRKTWNTI